MSKGFISTQLQTDPMKDRVFCDVGHKAGTREHGLLEIQHLDGWLLEVSLCRSCWRRLRDLADDMLREDQ